MAERTGSYLLIGLLGNTRSFEGALVSPIAGALSDRTWLGWLGRRRPFILVGGLLSAALLALTPTIGRVPSPFGGELGQLAPAIGAIFLFTLTFNTMDDVHKALLADLTEGAARNWLAGLRVLVEMVGQVAILVIGLLLTRETIPDLVFATAGALMALGVLVTVVGVREPPPGRWAVRAAREEISPWTTLRRHSAAAYLCLVMFCYWSGISAVLPLVSVYTRDILGATPSEAQLLPALLLLSTTILALPMGWLGTRFGKRPVLAVGLAVMAAAGVAGLVITTREQGAALFLLAGIGNAAVMVLTIPLLADLVPREQIGAAAGLLAAAGSIAAPLASLIGGGLADLYGPRAIFGLMVLMVLVAMAVLPSTRERVPPSDQSA